MRRTRVAGLGLVIAVGALGWPALDSPAGAHPAAAKQAAGQSAAAQQVAARGSGVTGGVPGLTADAVRTQVGVGADAQQRALTQYWTPQRMRLAISADQQPAVRTAAAKLRVTQARQAAAARTAARTGAGGAARAGVQARPTGPVGQVDPVAPRLAEPGVGQPRAAQSRTAQSPAAHSAAAQSGRTQSGAAAQSGRTQSGAAAQSPAAAQSGRNQSGAAARSGAAQSGAAQSGVAQSGAAQSGATARTAAGPTLTAGLASFNPGYPAGHPVARTYGKVFFTNTTNHLNYVCSATVVNSEGRDAVWTAGHCVHGGAGGSWHANWVFAPNYYYGANAYYGLWYANQLWTRTGWASSSDLTEDMGVAIVGTRYGYHIVDYTGGQGIAWNYSKDYYAYDFGYPQEAPFDGGRLIGCAGTTFPEWTFLWWSADTIGLHCDMTRGSSGGAWLRWFNGSWGYINGLNSYKYDNDPSTMYSPYFDGAASSLYNTIRYR